MSEWYELINLIRSSKGKCDSSSFNVGKWSAYVDYVSGRVELKAPDEQSQFLAQLPKFVAVGRWVSCNLSDLDAILEHRFKNMYGHAAESTFKSFLYRATTIGATLTKQSVEHMLALSIAKAHPCAIRHTLDVEVGWCYNQRIAKVVEKLIRYGVLKHSYVASIPWYCRILPYTKNQATSTWVYVGNTQSISVSASFTVDGIDQHIKTSMCVA